MDIKPHNFWYAVNNTEVVVMPAHTLETFGATRLQYRLVTELMDSVNRVRIREGAIHSHRPQIITPAYYANEILEGFGQEAHAYADWLREHTKDLRILEYGFKVQKTELSEQVVSGSVIEVLEQVKTSVATKNDPLIGVIRGVDEPWDVCLLKFMVDVIRRSMPHNIRDIARRRLWDDSEGVPRGVREAIDQQFLMASRDPSLIKPLAASLQKFGLFEEYEDRFFALLRGRKP